ncbi:MAG: hypothetical protein GIX03_01725 [Candidatus Eremiobacteraeota bacterium]|nr:hypothetical protein [Candidatus Eremiobacteraeota bacterium]MBC5801737.1 hypothetical protein [Candidatus Eremiobacteraeota bacterium]MBC5821515.1 hypothetical protein [Candidatus Eremiobacteraeota bacterium]
MKRYGGVLAGCIATVAVLLAAGFRATPYDNYVLLADALRHGRVWIDWPGAYIDALRYNGHYYVIEAPLPALLLLPAVALFGTATNQSALAAVLAGIATFAAWQIGRALTVPLAARTVLCVFLLLGTDLFWCATFGDVWFIAHVSAVAFTLLALLELLGRQRAWVVALFAASAVESRFSMLGAVPVYAAMLGLGIGRSDVAPNGRDARLRLVGNYMLVLVPVAALWVAYNQARWGTPYDVGYTGWFHQDAAGSPTGSPFALRYFGYQVQSFFVQTPAYTPIFPYLVPGFGGVALTWTSPGLLVAFFARRPKRLVLALWAAALLCAAPDFLYYVNGFAQFGMRHALDFEPFLFVLMVLAARRGLGVPAMALCWFSIAVGAWGVWFWRTFVRH